MSATVRTTSIPGLLVMDLTVHGDDRGWFKENWQREKMTELGLPDFGPVQHSVSYNASSGVTRGVHAEPWDKLVSIVHGRAFAAWVDLREGDSFGATHTELLDEHTAVFVPRGVGNSYQTHVDHTVYSYLVNAHWSPQASYTMLNLADPTIDIAWPIPLDQATISAKDLAHPFLPQVQPVASPRTLILGASGQLGTALQATFPQADKVTREQLDIADQDSLERYDFTGVDTVINAAAFTAVDDAETPGGRTTAWAVNATGVASLARAALQHGFRLVHYSSDYVFDGSADTYVEDAPLAPLGVYGQSKAAGDLAVSVVPRHYLIRTSWVIGEGKNFVRTMQDLADRGVAPQVVSDQVGRLTFTTELARATAHLLSCHAPFGTYNVTNDGDPMSWADIARQVYLRQGQDPEQVSSTSTAEYVQASGRAQAPRPATSTLSLRKLEASGFTAVEQLDALDAYLRPTP